MIKIGYIGFGRFAKHRHSILVKMSRLRFIGYFDANNIDKEFDLQKFESVEELLSETDAVIVSVPPFFAADLVKRALSMGVHVFCEKPPAVQLIDLDGLELFSDKLVLGYGFNHRLHDSVMTIKKIIESNEMGKVLWMRGRYGKEVNDSYRNDWRCSKELNGGGILIDQGIHLLDIMDWLAGGFDVNQAILSDSFLRIEGVEDNAFINLYSSNSKISASLHSTITQWRYLFSLEIFLEKGSVILNGLRTKSGSYGEETLTICPERSGTYLGVTSDRTVTYAINNSWAREMEAFVHSVEDGELYPYAGLDEAKNIMRLLGEVYSNAIWVDKS